MRKHKEENYWSKFAYTYDNDGEYIIGKNILQTIDKKLLKEIDLGKVIEF